MSGAENFVARWSRLKRDTAKEVTEADAARPKPDEADATAAHQGSEDAAPTTGRLAEPAFDVASLPSIDSITGSSDIRAFLQSGVPVDLTKAALRRAWTTDPAIRDFVGIAENQWDFTDPNAMPGFGPLEATDDVGKLVAQAMGKLGQASDPAMDAGLLPQQGVASTSTAMSTPTHEPPSQLAGMPVENDPQSIDGQAGVSVETQNSIVNVAPQHTDAPALAEAAPNRRAHGRALPR
jgi:Protein of unknown function (DUF3306)